ncbi:MAG: hypothetical protein KAS71_11750, partial [Bacteroidales bacterium]|nr:hypothetical protein [Bacteroidales bacterium]
PRRCLWAELSRPFGTNSKSNNNKKSQFSTPAHHHTITPTHQHTSTLSHYHKDPERILGTSSTNIFRFVNSRKLSFT